MYILVLEYLERFSYFLWCVSLLGFYVADILYSSLFPVIFLRRYAYLFYC